MSDTINNYCCDAIKPLLEGEFIYKTDWGKWRCGFFATRFIKKDNYHPDNVEWNQLNTPISFCPFCGAEL